MEIYLKCGSVYTKPFVYDSLCEYTVVSDTITLDTLSVGLEELKPGKQAKLTIIPNPACDIIRVVLPECVSSHSQAAIFNVTTWKYNYKGDVPLEIYDIYGRKWHEQIIEEGEKEVEIDVSALPAGLYVVQVKLEGEIVSGKFIKE
ncbi:MAG: T9SS type A sorting domain-containing protein [Bacteroidetes bacterium]|nr:T9SS type A sorting domain-containing protein [Bacteroidota bacterium]